LRDAPEYMVKSCFFCNAADNQYITGARERGLAFDGLTRDEVFAQRKPYVDKKCQEYHDFWGEYVEGQSASA